MHVRRSHWLLFLLAVFALAAGGFGYLESAAMHDPNGLTLSQFTVNIITAWPPIVFIAGLAVGIFLGTLNTHFTWPWVPKQKRTECVQCGKTVLLSVLALLILWPAPAPARDLTLPDPALTPGVATDITAEMLCDKKFTTRDVRSVTAKMKREVFARYGLTGNKDKACKPDKHGRRCEVDHLISLELGGANDIENLWPEPFGTKPWNAQLKDKVENKLNREVCAGNLTLEQAQHDILDYRVPYIRYFGEP